MRVSMRLLMLLFLILPVLNVNIVHISAQEDELIYTLAVAWNHDGTKIASVGVRPHDAQGYIRVVDTQTMQTIYQLEPQPGGFTSVSWSPDDRFIAVGSFDSTVWIIDLLSGTHSATLQGHQSTVNAVDWNSDGTKLVSGGNWDKLVFLWDMITYQPTRSLETPNFIYSVAFSPDDQEIAVGGESGLFVFPSSLEVGDSRDQLRYQYIRGYSSVVAWNADGDEIAFGTQTFRLSNGERLNAHVFVIDANNRNVLQDIESRWGSIAGVSWSPDSALLAVYHQDDLVTILERESGTVLETYTGSGSSRYSIGNLDFSPYGGRLAYGITTDTQTQARAASLERLGISVVVPAPSLERLQAIADACNAPIAVEQSLTTSIQSEQLAEVVAQVEALPDDTIPPACAADLIAVAEALQSR